MPRKSPQGPSRDFAITSVDVPDRLDVREALDRSRHEEESRGSLSWRTLSMWAWRGFLFLGALVLLFLLATGVRAWRQDFSAAGVAGQLARGLGEPVQVADSSVRLIGSPQWHLRGLRVGGRAPIDDIAVHVGWLDLARLVAGDGGGWAEVELGSARWTLAQAREWMGLVPRLRRALPFGVRTLRMSELRITDVPWLAGPCELMIRLDQAGASPSLTLSRREGDGQWSLRLAPEDAVALIPAQFEARNWALPFVPEVRWSEVLASGTLGAERLDLAEVTLGAPFGVVHAAVRARREGSWKVDGEIHATGIDLQTLLARPVPSGAGGSRPGDRVGPAVLQGTLALEALASGRGADLADAASHLVLEGLASIRWGELNGINLGYAATRPGGQDGTQGGSTRFTDLRLHVHAAEGRISLGEIHGKAGAMRVWGEVDIDPQGRARGNLHVDLGATRVQAPLRLQVHGPALQPVFGRP